MSKDRVEVLWQTQVLPIFQELAEAVPFDIDEPLLSGTSFQAKIEASKAVDAAGRVMFDSIGMAAKVLAKSPTFPFHLFRNWYRHGPDSLILPINALRGLPVEQFLVSSSPSEMAAQVQRARTLTRLFVDDRTGFSVIDYVTSSPEERELRVDTYYPKIAEELIRLGGERYKFIYGLIDQKSSQ